MLKDSFYTVQEVQESTSSLIKATIRLNMEHHIFGGHFPAQPVVPGVCMLQIIKECLEGAGQQRIQLTKSHNIKFLTMLIPTEHEVIDVRINFESSENGILVSEATMLAGAVRFIKMQQVYYARLITSSYPNTSAAL